MRLSVGHPHARRALLVGERPQVTVGRTILMLAIPDQGWDEDATARGEAVLERPGRTGTDSVTVAAGPPRTSTASSTSRRTGGSGHTHEAAQCSGRDVASERFLLVGLPGALALGGSDPAHGFLRFLAAEDGKTGQGGPGWQQARLLPVS